MDKVVIETARTENGYSGACELLPGWIVATTGDFDNFKKEVVDSIRFYVDCAKRTEMNILRSLMENMNLCTNLTCKAYYFIIRVFSLFLLYKLLLE